MAVESVKTELKLQPYAVPGEAWKQIPDFPGYEASSMGRIRSVDRFDQNGVLRHGQVLRRWTNGKKGYLCVCPSVNGKHRAALVHRLVAAAFLGPCPPGHECNHRDGAKHNCAMLNIEYVTPAENVRHAYAIGLQKPKSGERSGNARLKLCEVEEIRRLSRSVPCKVVAAMFKVATATVYDIRSGRRWPNL
jgi:hypothetical protein